ncbi:MAG: hypothetical protein DRQ62_09675, partial [Gammaproteobacteria bacterium]
MKKVLWICIALMISVSAQAQTYDRWGVQDLRYGGSWTRTMSDGSTLTPYGVTPINVIGFGAIPGDGIDDTPYIQAAVDSCGVWGGGAVYIPA